MGRGSRRGKQVDPNRLKRVVSSITGSQRNQINDKTLLTRIARQYFGYSKSTKVSRKCLNLIRNRCTMLNFGTDFETDRIQQDETESIEDTTIEENIQGRIDPTSPVQESEEQGKGKIKASEETEQDVCEHLSDSERHSWQTFVPISPLSSLAGMCSIYFIMAVLMDSLPKETRIIFLFLKCEKEQKSGSLSYTFLANQPNTSILLHH